MKVEIILFCVTLVALYAAHAETGHDGLAPAPFKDLENNEIQQTIDFLKRGERFLKIDDNYRDVIMLVGNTGAGKSTMTQFLAGDLADLKSIGEDNFIIESSRKGVIGNSTTVSHTIYPDLVIDETKIAFYDCPGYDDTRSMSIEVASTFFVKKVVDHSDSLKLILVVEYNSVRKGGSRTDFPKLVRHFRNFAKNVTAYSNSIALIATKVPNEYVRINKVPVLRSDEQVIGVIVQFLQEYRNQVKSEESSNFNAYAIELIEILLRKNDNGRTYKKIGFFRSPDEAGPFNRIESMVEQRGKLRDMILNRTTYGKKVDEYFGYTISETSRLKLIDLSQVVNQKIEAAVGNISKEIEENFRGDERKLGNLDDLTNRFQSGYKSLSDIVGNSENMNGSVLVTELVEATNSLRVAISHEFLDEISNLEQYIGFGQTFTTDHLPLTPTEWLAGLKGCVDYLDETKNWFKFLSDIYYQFSQYEFQCDRTKYNVFDVNDWGTAGRPQGIHINSDNFKTFVKKQKSGALIENHKPTESRLAVLNNLLGITIKQVPVVSCEADNTKLVVKGEYVRTNDINITQCGDKLKQLHIFALHTVFIDSNINAVGLRLNLSIVAPKWYIFGKQKINLSGAKANNTFAYDEAVNPAARPEVDAYNGAPGKPGGKAGNFVGLGLNFVNGDKLEICANGGQGSPGQNGGNGFRADDPDVLNLKPYENGGNQLNDRNYRSVEHDRDSECVFLLIANGCTHYFVVHGECGSSGGDGGQGGKGGRSGFLRLFELGSKSEVSLAASAGPNGEPGMGGRIGRNPKKIRLIHQTKYFIIIPANMRFYEDWRVDDDTCPPLHESANGVNDEEGMDGPEPSSDNEPVIPLNEFKTFLRENQKNNLRRDDLAQFIDQIHNSDSILASYTTKDFVNELLTLENQFYTLHNEIDLASYYYSISNRIERFVGQRWQLPQEQRKVFNYLYAAAWGKYLALNSTESLMVIDVDGYLDAAIENIRKFDASARRNIIDDKREDYRADIDSKIYEATALIQLGIIPAIEDVSKLINDNLNALVDETVDREEESVLEYTRLQKKLINQLGIRALFGVLNADGLLAACLGPIAMAARAIADGVSQIGGGFLADSAIRIVMSIPEGVKTDLDDFDKSMKKRKEVEIEGLEEVMTRIKDETENHSETLGDFNINIDDLLKQLGREKYNPRKDQEDTIAGFITQLKTMLMSKAEELGKDKDELNENEKNALETVEQWKRAIDVLQLSPEVYKMFADDADKLEEVRKAYEKSEKMVDEMQSYRQKIYSKMWPMVNEMRKQIDDVERGLTGQSQAALKLKKWQIQSTIRDTKFTLQKFTKGFKIQEDLVQVLQKLDEAFETLINVYDHIESYYDHEKLGDYIAAIASAGVANIEVSDPDLKSALLQLDLMISSNVVLNNYNRAIDAFKQAVFPFAASYLDQYRLPKDLQLVNTTDSLVKAAAANLESLQTKISEYNRYVINGHDKYIITASFDSRLRCSHSFFEWKSEDFQHSIADLFAGRKISLRADIKEGLQLNAVKFNEIKLVFIAHDAERQTELDSQLMKFKIYLTHTGNSYYRCGASYYVFDSPSQEIMYSFEQVDGVPVHSNDVYEKLRSGTIMLSPYTLWSIRLENSSKDHPEAFDYLSSLAEHTDLVLIGRGQYVSNDAHVCETKLDDYYEFV